MKAVSATTSDSQQNSPDRGRPYDLSIVTLLVLTVFPFYPVLQDLAYSVIGNELAHHSPLVFALTVFLIYQDRKSIAQLIREASDRGPISPMVAGLLLNSIGQILGITYLAQLSFPLTLYGMVLYLKGPMVARRLMFPIAFLFFAFPIPGKIYYQVIFPLKLFVTKCSAEILLLLGYNVTSEGNIIQISSTMIGVADACSGLNSLMAMLTLSTFYTYMILRRMIYRVLIVSLMFPLVMAVNAIRVTATCIVAVTWGDEVASGSLHTFWGIFVFAASVIGLMVITNIFVIMERRDEHGR
jgi:exosortase